MGWLKKYTDGGWMDKYQEGGTIPKAQGGKSFEDITGVKPIKSVSQQSEKQPINKVDAQLIRDLAPNQYENKSSLKSISKKDFNKTASVKDVLLNPMTALKYKVQGQNIPANFTRGERNPLDYAIDAVNPFMFVNAAGNTVGNLAHPINTLSTLGKAGTNLLTNMTDGQNAFDDGSNEKALGILGDAALTGGALSPHVNWKNIPKVIEANELTRSTHQLRQGLKHPFVKTIKELVKEKEYGKIPVVAAQTVANRLAPVIGKSPIIKDLAERVMAQSSAPDRSFSSIKELLGFGKKPTGYDGKIPAFGSPSLSEDLQKRNLLKNYLYDDATGFTENTIKPIGLEKYIEKYGPLKSYDLEFNPASYQMDHRYIPGKGLSGKALYNLFMRESDEFRNAGEYSKSKLDDYLKNKIAENDGIFPMSSDKHDIYMSSGGLDNIAGHMNYFKLDANGNPMLHVQDIWKFAPEDYNSKWGHFRNKDRYVQGKQAAILDNVGKPFILSKEIPIYYPEPPSQKTFNLMKRMQRNKPMESSSASVSFKSRPKPGDRPTDKLTLKERLGVDFDIDEYDFKHGGTIKNNWLNKY